MIARTARGAFALMLLGSAALVGTPSFAAEPEADTPVGPDRQAPRGAEPVFAADVVIDEPATPIEE
jgi:hypothetical protein